MKNWSTMKRHDPLGEPIAITGARSPAGIVCRSDMLATGSCVLPSRVK